MLAPITIQNIANGISFNLNHCVVAKTNPDGLAYF